MFGISRTVELAPLNGYEGTVRQKAVEVQKTHSSMEFQEFEKQFFFEFPSAAGGILGIVVVGQLKSSMGVEVGT